jgi:hypothetical protein
MPPRKITAAAEPVNSEQLEKEEREQRQDPEADEPAAGSPAAPSTAAEPTLGEFEERAAEAEERAGAAEQRAEAAEGRVATLEEEMAELKRTLNKLLRAEKAKSADARAAEHVSFEIEDEQGFFLDMDRPYGVIVGDVELGYEQDGHQFGHDRKYVRSLPTKLRGCGRPFNPRLVGHVKPRPGLARADQLDGIRDRE